jgi:LEA14-like dessication related protein
MKKALLILGGLSVLGFGLYKYFKTQADLLSKFTWKISGVKNVKISFTELSMDINILLTSVADIEAKIIKMYFDLYIQGTNVGFVSNDKEFIIPANGSSTIPLHISINPQSIFKNLIDVTLGAGKQKDVMFKLDGYVNVKSGFISTTLPIVYETSIKEYLKGVVPTK